MDEDRETESEEKGNETRGGTLVGERENEGEPGLEMKKKPMNVD